MTTNARPRSSIWSSRSLIWNFAQRDLKTRFKGTALGWAWSLVVPLAALLTYSLVFSVVFRATPPDLGSGQPGSFPIWLFCGLIAWSFFQVSVNLAIPTLLAHGPLLQKVYFPSYAPIVGSMGGVLVQTMIEFAILGVVLILVGNVGVSWLMFPMWMLIFVTFVTSLAVALAIMNVYFRDLAHITSVALGLLFFLTPIIYPINLVPEEWNGIPLRAIVAFNPISEFVESLRLLLYGIAIPPWPVWLGLVAWMLGALALAAFTYRRWGLDIGESV